MDTIKCSMPVIIETGFDEWPYAVRGTFFVAEVLSDLYVVTARHVVEGNDENTVFFRYRAGSRSSLPLNQVIKNKAYQDSSSPEYTDVILYRVAKEELNEVVHTAKLDVQQKPWETLRAGEHLFVRGYPSELQDVKDSGLKEQGVLFNASYTKRTQHSGCHEIKLNPTETFTHYDGFSGSPVYCVRDSVRFLVGIMVKATAFQNIGLFVDGSVLLAMAAE